MNEARQIFVLRAVVFAFVAVVCLWRLGSTPLLETDEGFAANRAASMFRHHTWRLSFDDVDDDKPQFRKPPLLYWAVASLYPVVGRNEWAVRLPGALASIAACWLLYRINRRHFDETTALGSVLLFTSIPFILVHMRTAMLEMPLLALTLSAIYALAYLPDRRGTAVLAGFAAGGALLMKGLPGFLGLGAAVVITLALDRFSARAWKRSGIALLVAAAIFALYSFAIVPHRWREAMLFSMFVKEGSSRTLDVAFAKRASAALGPFWDTARYLVVLLLPGLACALYRSWRKPESRGWWLLFLLIVVPVVVVGQKQVVPYPRYFIPAYAFLATLAALAIGTLLRHRSAAGVVLLALAGLTYFSPDARNYHPSSREMPIPGMQEVAKKVPAHVPPGEKVILCSKKIKCHQLLFYGQRAVASQAAWLRDDFQPGTVRYAVVAKGFYMHTPLVEAKVLFENEHFQFMRLEVSNSRPNVTGIVVCRPEDSTKIAEKLSRENRRFEAFAGGFLLF